MASLRPRLQPTRNDAPPFRGCLHGPPAPRGSGQPLPYFPHRFTTAELARFDPLLAGSAPASPIALSPPKRSYAQFTTGLARTRLPAGNPQQPFATATTLHNETAPTIGTRNRAGSSPTGAASPSIYEGGKRHDDYENWQACPRIRHGAGPGDTSRDSETRIEPWQARDSASGCGEAARDHDEGACGQDGCVCEPPVADCDGA